MVDIENPWNIQSFYDLQFFNCPTCDFKDYSKQEMVNHAYEYHPASIPFLVNIKDDSLMDVFFPWDNIDIKREPEVEITVPEIKTEFVKQESNDNNDDYYMDTLEYTNPNDVKMDYQCKDCNLNFSTQMKYQKHVANVHGDFNCKECNKDFPTKLQYSKHMNNVHSESVKNRRIIKNAQGESVTCEKCFKVFKDKYNMKQHVQNVHEDIRKYKCKLCNAGFHKMSGLKKHMEKETSCIETPDSKDGAHEDKKILFQCERCGKDFNSKVTLRTHMKHIHEGIGKDFHCEKCSYTAYSQSILNNHIQVVHEGVRNHICDLCGKTYGDKRNLRNHILAIHEDVKMFQCDKCEYKTAYRQHLRKHILSVHDGVKQYQCDLCAKGFISSYHLKRHIITVHEKLKNEICSYCNKAYGQKAELNKHIKTVHKSVAMALNLL